MSETPNNLVKRLQAGERSNELDVLIEVALFKPDKDNISAHANAAGTKVIYIDPVGKEFTNWAPDWTRDPAAALASLKKLGYA